MEQVNASISHTALYLSHISMIHACNSKKADIYIVGDLLVLTAEIYL